MAAVAFALGSCALEGLVPGSEARELARRFVAGSISLDQLVASRPA
ncbi:antitoxin VbhA family protein [Stenotrophomonas sp. AB1(2024)]